MELNELTGLLPAGLLGIGGLIPILIGRNPFTLDETHRPILATLFVLLVWSSYLAAYMIYRWTFSGQWLALCFLALAVLCFAIILKKHLFPPEPKTVSGLVDSQPNPVKDSPAAENPRRSFLLYCAGIMAVTVAASVLTAGNNWVVIDVAVESPSSGQKLAGVALMKKADHELFIRPASRSLWFALGYRIVVPKEDFNNAAWDTVEITMRNAQGISVHETPKSTLRRVLQPGDTQCYEGTATQTAATSPTSS